MRFTQLLAMFSAEFLAFEIVALFAGIGFIDLGSLLWSQLNIFAPAHSQPGIVELGVNDSLGIKMPEKVMGFPVFLFGQPNKIPLFIGTTRTPWNDMMLVAFNFFGMGVVLTGQYQFVVLLQWIHNVMLGLQNLLDGSNCALYGFLRHFLIGWHQT